MDIIFCVISVQKRQSAGKQSGRQAADEGNESGKAAGAVERVAALSVQQTPAADRDADGTAGSHQRPSTPPLTDGALLGRTLRKITEEEKVRLYPHSCHSCIWSAFSSTSPGRIVYNTSHPDRSPFQLPCQLQARHDVCIPADGCLDTPCLIGFSVVPI